MLTKIKVYCNECKYRTERRAEDNIIYGHCHLHKTDKHGFESCEDGKHRNEEALRFDAEQVDFE
jgi:hypothetical protein